MRINRMVDMNITLHMNIIIIFHFKQNLNLIIHIINN